MILDRRSFVAGSTALLLPGCAATVSRRAAAPCAPLAQLTVDQRLVVRSIAGLRPYRSSGFVVRRVQLGDKALVHNYGHGGSGITFSWGTARLAVDLGIQGHSGAVAVLGAGVIGLTTARLVQEAGLPVTIYTAAMPPNTTSNIAGGQIMPSSLFRMADTTPAWWAQYEAALDYSVRRWEALVGAKYGVRRLPTYAETDGSPPPQAILRAAQGWRELARGEHPFPLDHVARYETMYVETPRFLQQATADLLAASGKIRHRRFASPADILGLEETLVFNCTGLGSRDLFGDEQLIPVRGQLAILAPQPAIDYAYTVSAGYMFPRADGIVLGGTFERGEFDPTPQPADIAHIVESHRAFQASFRCTA